MNYDEHLDLDLERAILSTCLNNDEAYLSIADDIEPSDFSLAAHQEIFKAMKACFNANEPISLTFIKKHKKFDEHLLNEIIATTPVDIIKYTQELKEKAIKRQLLSFSHILPTKINENRPVSEISDEISKEIFNITHRAGKDSIKDMHVVIGELLEEFKRQKEAQNKDLLGIDTGFSDLNKATKGFKDGELIIIAARPGMGKTTIALNFIEKTLRQNKGVVLFSLEMPATQIMQRLIGAKTSISLQKVMTGDLNTEEWERVSDACNDFSKKHFYIYDSGYVGMSDVRAVLRKLKAQDDSISLCVLDYIGLMHGNSKLERHLQVSEISRGLKLLARELEMPIIALSQLNREVDRRSNRRPLLSDLRESGSIEQDADIIMFVYRDEVYKERDEKEREQKAKAEGKVYQRTFFPDPKQEKAELIVEKNRNGPLATINLIFHKQFSNFTQAPKQDFVATEFKG